MRRYTIVSSRYTLYAAAALVLLMFSGCGKPGVQEREQAPAQVQQETVRKHQPKRQKEVAREITRKDSTKRIGRDKNRVDPDADPRPPEFEARSQKRVFEFVEIAGRHYEVPRPWRGKKITDPQPPLSVMEQIPREFSYNGSRLYVHRQARQAFVRMAEEAKEDGIRLVAHSGFRSSAYQRKIFTSLMAQGRSWDDLVRYVAPPGYSSHMLGFSIDLYPSNWRFASTEAYRWLRRHGSEFGFYETYPESGRGGYPWEAWHWQFIPEREKDEAAEGEQTAADGRPIGKKR